MPTHDLMEVAKRLRDEAHGGLADVEEDRESVAPPPVRKGYEDARDTCDFVPGAKPEYGYLKRFSYGAGRTRTFDRRIMSPLL